MLSAQCSPGDPLRPTGGSALAAASASAVAPRSLAFSSHLELTCVSPLRRLPGQPPSSSLDTRPPSVLGLLALPADYFSPLFPAATDAAAVVPALPSPSIVSPPSPTRRRRVCGPAQARLMRPCAHASSALTTVPAPLVRFSSSTQRRRGRSGTLTLACKVPLPLGSESSDDSDSDSSSSDEVSFPCPPAESRRSLLHPPTPPLTAICPPPCPTTVSHPQECLIEDDSLPRHNHNRHHNHSHRNHHSYNHHASGTVSPSFSDASDKSEDSAGPLTPPTLVGAIALPQQSPPPSPSTTHPTCSSQPVATLSPTSPASPSSPYPARSRVRGGVVVRFGEAPGVRLPVTPPLELNLVATAARPSIHPTSWSPTSLSSPSGPPPLSTTTILLDEDDDDDDDDDEEEEDVVSDDDDSSSDEDNYDAVDTGRVASPPLSPTTLLASKPQPNDTFQSAASRATPLTRCASTSSPPVAAVLPVDDAFLDNVDIYALSSASSSSSCTNFTSADDEPDSDDEDDPYSVLAPAAAPGGGATWLAPDGTWRVDWLALGEYLRMVEKRLRPIVDPVRRSPLSFSWIPEEEEEKERERAREWVSAVEEEETDEWLAMDDFVLEWEDE